jgi:hypothetical protein
MVNLDSHRNTSHMFDRLEKYRIQIVTISYNGIFLTRTVIRISIDATATITIFTRNFSYYR